MKKRFRRHNYTFLKTLFWLIRCLDIRKRQPLDLRTASRILLVSTTAIGDTLLSTPALRAVRKNFPHGHIVVLVHTKIQEVLAGNPYVDELIVYEGKYKGTLRLLQKIRAMKTDLAVILHANDPDMVPILYLSGIPFIAGWKESKFSFLLTHATPRATGEHMIQHRLDILKTAGITGNGEQMDLFVAPSDRVFVGKYLAEKNTPRKSLIGIHPFGSVPSKSWTRFPDFLNAALRELPGCAFVIIGGKKEADNFNNLHHGPPWNNSRILWAAGELSLPQSAALIRKCSCLITTDSGPMQMALAQNIPTLILAGPTDMKRTGPLDLKTNIVIQKDVPCRPCDLKACDHHQCMNLISAEEILNGVKSLKWTV